MAKPANINLNLTLPTGEKYGLLRNQPGWPGLRERYAMGTGGVTTGRLVCLWEDSAAVLETLIGKSTFTSGDPLYTRSNPFLCPWAEKQYGVEAVQVMPLGNGTPDPAFDNWTKYDLSQYDVTFRTLPFVVTTDTLAAADAVKERSRYMSYREEYEARERKVSSTGYETDEASPQVVQEVGFVPDVCTVITATQYQVPYPSGINWDQIEYCTLRVNLSSFVLNGRSRAAETLLYLTSSYGEDYPGVNGERYVDVVSHWKWRPFGWNTVRKNNGSYVKIRQRGSSASPKYPYKRTSLFRSLFEPPGTTYSTVGDDP